VLYEGGGLMSIHTRLHSGCRGGGARFGAGGNIGNTKANEINMNCYMHRKE